MYIYDQIIYAALHIFTIIFCYYDCTFSDTDYILEYKECATCFFFPYLTIPSL